MSYTSVFKRAELKYIVTPEQKRKILQVAEGRLALDSYGRSSVRSIYFDTPDYRLIRRSLEKPDYKEKLRVRSYGEASDGDRVFVELKKKYDGIVYKRRVSVTTAEADRWLWQGGSAPFDSQIIREIDYFRAFYRGLSPMAFISYEREAFYSPSDSGFRMTFDDNILFRDTELSLSVKPYGRSILPEGQILMELKCFGGVPLWLARVLSELSLYKRPFSKYGTAYSTLIFPRQTGSFCSH